MLFQRFTTPGLAQHSYLLQCGDGKAVVVDPRRDIDAYVELARGHALQIAYALETHRQEDFEYGAASLAAVTGAKIVTGDHALFGHSDMKLADGAALEVGSTRLVLLGTPGHTPESVCYAVYVDQAQPACWAVFTGDTLFPGATGRTDLADPARTAENAGRLYDAVHHRLAPLGAQALIYAAHGSGSACGSNIADREGSTLGIEMTANPVFTLGRAAYIAHKLSEHLPRPPYFTHMEQVNLAGGRPPPDDRRVRALQLASFEAAIDGRIVLDTREPEAFASSHIAGSYNIWLGGVASFAGWIANEHARILMVADGTEQVMDAALSLARIGLDHVDGFLAGGIAAWRESGRPIATTGIIGAADAAAWLRRDGAVRVLDVRDDDEWTAGHLRDALHTYVGHLPRALPGLPRDAPLIVQCSVGHRAGLAASILARAGFGAVYNMLGGMKAWRALELPVSRDEPDAR